MGLKQLGQQGVKGEIDIVLAAAEQQSAVDVCVFLRQPQNMGLLVALGQRVLHPLQQTAGQLVARQIFSQYCLSS